MSKILLLLLLYSSYSENLKEEGKKLKKRVVKKTTTISSSTNNKENKKFNEKKISAEIGFGIGGVVFYGLKELDYNHLYHLSKPQATLDPTISQEAVKAEVKQLPESEHKKNSKNPIIFNIFGKINLNERFIRNFQIFSGILILFEKDATVHAFESKEKDKNKIFMYNLIKFKHYSFFIGPIFSTFYKENEIGIFFGGMIKPIEHYHSNNHHQHNSADNSHYPTKTDFKDLQRNKHEPHSLHFAYGLFFKTQIKNNIYFNFMIKQVFIKKDKGNHDPTITHHAGANKFSFQTSPVSISFGLSYKINELYSV